MSDSLIKEYGVTKIEAMLCGFLRMIRGTNTPPKFIYKRSRKKYGFRDNLARYWWKRFYNIDIGKYTYGYESLCNSNLKSIGAFCSIGTNQTIVPNDHRMDLFTTSPITSHEAFGFVDRDIINDYCPPKSREVRIGNDVWIGTGCVIFEGVTIGDGAVIAARSIVRKDVPPYAVVAGVDRIVKYRFEKDKIDEMINSNWWNLDDKEIKKLIGN